VVSGPQQPGQTVGPHPLRRPPRADASGVDDRPPIERVAVLAPVRTSGVGAVDLEGWLEAAYGQTGGRLDRLQPAHGVDAPSESGRSLAGGRGLSRSRDLNPLAFPNRDHPIHAQKITGVWLDARVPACDRADALEFANQIGFPILSRWFGGLA
jgi:hypothetical protein